MEVSKERCADFAWQIAVLRFFEFWSDGNLALQDITKHAYANPFVAKLSERLMNSLELLRRRLLTGSPRVLTCRMLETFCFFTDASFSRTMVEVLVRPL